MRAGRAGPLAGLVLGIKDVLALQGKGLQAASSILDGFRSEFTATSLQRLLDADAIIIGRQNCDEFAMGSSNERSTYGPAVHPHDPQRVPGGSSGASAASVAAGCCHAALGTDTGGSVRQPAAFCGVVGMKPTYGTVSRWGLLAYASSFDQIGSLTHSVRDAAELLDLMAGIDGRDHTMQQREGLHTAASLDLPLQQPLRIGVMEEVIGEAGLDPDMSVQVQQVIDRLRSEGHLVEICSFPLLPFLVPCYYILTTAEASSNLSRYDGVHYGRRSQHGKDLADLYRQSRSEGFGLEVQKRILLGSFVLSAGHVEAYFTHAQRVRRLIQQETFRLFDRYDLLLSPTTPGAAFRQGEKLKDPVKMYLSDIFTVHANLIGAPAISLPMGLDRDSMPLGLQLMAPPWQEAALLRAAYHLLPDDRKMILS